MTALAIRTVKLRLLVVVLMVLGVPAVSAKTVTVTNSATLDAAVASAAGGDTILLEAGSYGSVTINNKVFTDVVSIRAKQPLQAILEQLTITQSSKLEIDGITVANPGNGGGASALVSVLGGSSHISVKNSVIHGLVDGQFDGWYGLHTSNSDTIRFDNNRVHDVRVGVVSFSDNVTVVENVFEDIGEDSMKFAGNNLLIENNTGATNYHPLPGYHADFIQFQGSSANVTVRGNVSVQSDMSDLNQGIFADNGTFSNFLIEHNVIYHGLNNAIFVNDKLATSTTASNIVARNNTVLTFPNAGNKASIISVAGSKENNVFGWYQSQIDSGPDRSIQYVDSSKPDYYNAYYLNPMKGEGTTLADLAPVSGGPADCGSGLGAEARICALLASPPAPPTNPRSGSWTLAPLLILLGEPD